MGRKPTTASKMWKRLLLSFILSALICLTLLPAIPAHAAGDPEKYTATAADGMELAMKRYRPDATASFHIGAQPVICMPGIICGANIYDVQTPAGENYDLQLPSPLASWAQGDVYVQKDPMRYYSMAHYLWLQGYDVWLVNYRGEGRDPYLSGGQMGYTIDDLGIYDVPAIVEKVYDVTGQHPIWCAHSMGATMAYIYLQGAKYGEGDNPHVIADPALAEERNGGTGRQAIKALIDLDGPQIPSSGKLVNNTLVWAALYWPFYVDLRPLTANFGDMLAYPLLSLMNLVWQLQQSLGGIDLDLANLLVCINQNNLAPSVGEYVVKYVFDAISTRVLAQWADAGIHGKLREDYENGNGDLFPPVPAPNDGYYYYSDNMDKVTIPALVMADDRVDITNPDDIKNFYNAKTRNPLDTFIRVAGAAHVDLICGLNAPSFTYPEIGNWLKKLAAGNTVQTKPTSGRKSNSGRTKR
jgi:pimeloyl-ACP methyl ester carboxylesterase